MNEHLGITFMNNFDHTKQILKEHLQKVKV
jgi:hypothetical protein